ncbi:uncharacterized protein LOC132189067 isoform X3 [Corylus avellana]|uniref:uncharacterized protein LOC132189067 isoform X3 n=1 Tax=Corylus avellana TaxID=13451 RepID=UPI00286A019A|nr:uncharacterized protein LOC132189067 isoform X3 [Corylus avellana]
MEGMSGKKGQSAAVELKREISPTPREVAVLMSTIFLGSLGIVRLVNILDSRGLSFIADLLHLLGVVKLGFNLGEIVLTKGQSVTFLGYTSPAYNNLWCAFVAILSEIVNGLILADFCYYYLTLDFDQEHDMHLPLDLVWAWDASKSFERKSRSQVMNVSQIWM